jgi:hypothetical protein
MGIFSAGSSFKGLYNKPKPKRSFGKYFKKIVSDIGNIPILGDIINATPIGAGLNLFGSALSGDLRGVAKAGLGLLPGAAGKIGGAVAEFIPDAEEEDSGNVPYEQLKAQADEESAMRQAEQDARRERYKTDQAYKQEVDAGEKERRRIERESYGKKIGFGASDAAKMFGGGQKMVGGRVFG